MQWFYRDFDEAAAKCLFCQGECDVVSSSLPARLFIHENDYTCRTCSEYYKIYIFEGLDKNVSRIYSFSCGDYIVALGEKQEDFSIRKKDKEVLVYVPKFDIDLTDKEKLLEKLRTYLIFS
jgi:hypothetical protein